MNFFVNIPDTGFENKLVCALVILKSSSSGRGQSQKALPEIINPATIEMSYAT